MLKLLLAAAAFALPALPAAAQQTSSASGTQPAAKPTAADFAKNMQSVIGQTFEGGITVKSVTAEANTLVFVIGGPSGWRAELTEQTISDAMIGGFCKTSPDFFATGVTMRVDSLDDGGILAGPLANACPAQ